MLSNIRDAYPIVFGTGGGNRPHCAEYREFRKNWGFQATLYDIADKKIEKVSQIYQEYLNDFLQLLSYMMEEQRIDEIEDKFQQTLRDAKKRR